MFYMEVRKRDRLNFIECFNVLKSIVMVFVNFRIFLLIIEIFKGRKYLFNFVFIVFVIYSF